MRRYSPSRANTNRSRRHPGRRRHAAPPLEPLSVLRLDHAHHRGVRSRRDADAPAVTYPAPDEDRYIMTALPLSPLIAARLEHRSPAGSDPHCADARQPATAPYSVYPAAALSRPVETNAIATGPSSALRSWPCSGRHRPRHAAEIPIALRHCPSPASRAFVPWRVSDAGASPCGTVPSWRRPKRFTWADETELRHALPLDPQQRTESLHRCELVAT